MNVGRTSVPDRGDTEKIDVARALTTAATLARTSGSELVERAVVRLGEQSAQRLHNGVERLAELDDQGLAALGAAVASPEGSTSCDADLLWASCVLLGASTGPDGRFDAILRSERAQRTASRQEAPLPTERWRRAQLEGRVSEAQSACLQRLAQRARSGDALLGDAYRQLLDDCYDLVTGGPIAAEAELGEVLRRLDHDVLILDDRLRRIVENEWLQGEHAVRAEGPRLVVLVGPPSIGKRRFTRAAAAALGAAHHHVRCASLADDRHALLGRWSPPDLVVRGAFVDAALDSKGRHAIVLLEGIDELDDPDARLLSSQLVDIAEHPDRTLEDRYLPPEFAVDPRRMLVVVTAADVDRVPPALRDVAEVIEMGPPTPAQRVRIIREHLLPELSDRLALSRALSFDDAALVELVDRHDSRSGMRELARDLARVSASWRADGAVGPVDSARLARVLGSAPLRPGRVLAGSVWVPLLDRDSVAVVRLDVTEVPGAMGTLVPELLSVRTAAMVRDALDAAREQRPLGIRVASGIRVTLNLQSPRLGWHAPWLSTFAVLAACGLATGRTIDSAQGVLSVLGARGQLEPLDLPEPSVSAMVHAMDWSSAVTPGHQVEGAGTTGAPTDLEGLLGWYHFEPVADADHEAGMYL